MVVSIRDRKQTIDITGDPWDGRSLEWSTASPAPYYNFAHVPDISSLEQHWHDKETGRAYLRPSSYEPIHMPRNTASGFVISVFAAVMCFALIWHMWVIAGVTLAGAIISFIKRSYDRNVDYFIAAADVEAMENKRFEQLRKAA